MKAILVHKFGRPEVMNVEETAIPKCSDDQVLVKVKAAGVNPVDVYIRAGHFDLKFFPYTPGLDVAGIVEQVGSKVNHIQKGDRVFCCQVTGGYAEYALVGQRTCWPLANNMSFSQGAKLGLPYFTAYRSLFQRATTKRGDTVLVHGASGAVGNAAVQICKSLDIKVLGTAGTKQGMDLVKYIGAQGVFNHNNEGYLNDIKKAASDGGVNVILEMLANVNLANDLDILAPRGTIVLIGCRGETKINPMVAMHKEVTLKGVLLRFTTADEWQEMGLFICDGVSNGALNPIIEKEYTLNEVSKAHTHIMEHQLGSKGGIVITM